MKEIICRWCGSTCLVPLYSLRFRNRFCSQRCASTYHNTKFRRGRRNPRWRGGRVLNYGPNWKRAKEAVRARDKVCQACGKTPEENGRALDVHNIYPYRFSGDHSLDNLLAVCRSCHMRALDHGRKGSARFAGPQQLSLRPPSQLERRRERGRRQRERRRDLQKKAFPLHDRGHSLRQIAHAVGVSHQTIANWLAARPAPGTS